MTDANSIETRLRAALVESYRIERKLASGGMAIVYIAHDVARGRRVAVKVLRPELAAAVGSERFLREIQIAAGLNHPNILQVYDSGEADGLLYYVMPVADGESLREKLTSEKQLSADEAIRITREVAEALGYAHEHGVVHRDIKPENILLHADHAQVADFGVAKAVSGVGDAQLTETGFTVGTPSYMSPEQAAGEPTIDGRSDIYSLGCVLFEMLAGQPPFTGPSAQSIVSQHISATPPRIEHIRPGLLPSVGNALERSLAKTPADRFRSIEDFADNLEAAAPRAVDTRAGRWPKAVLLVAALAVVAVVVTSLWLTAREGTDPTNVASGILAFPPTPRVMVLPLDNRTGDEAFDGLGERAAEQITDGLASAQLWYQEVAQSGVLDVVARSEVHTFISSLSAESGVAPSRLAGDVARKAAAHVVVSGSYTRDHDSLQFRIEVRTRDGRSLPPPDRASGTAGDVSNALATLADQVTGAVAFSVTAGPWLAWIRRPPTYEAYEAWAVGNQAIFRRQWSEAEEGLRKALALAPNFTPAYARLGHGVLYNLGKYAALDSLAESMALTSPMTQADRAVRDQFRAVARGDVVEFYSASRVLADLVPYGPSRYHLGLWALAANHPRAGLDAFTLVLDSAPAFARAFPATWTWATISAHLLGEHDQELTMALRGRETVPDSPGIVSMMVAANAALGRSDEVRKLAEEALNADDLFRVFQASLELRAHGHGEMGDSLARQFLAVLEGRGPEDLPLQRVDALTMLNRLDNALEFLEETAVGSGGPAVEGRRGVILALQGNRAAAEQIIGELGAMTDPYAFGQPTLWRARIAASLGDQAQAVDFLRQAFDQGFTVVGPAMMIVVGHRDPVFQSLWDYEPFQEFVRPKG